jgi:uncharacterized protein (TIGR04141 family)
LRIEDLLSSVNDPATITLDDLKRWKIREFTVSEDTPSRQFSVYNATIYEVTQGSKLYVLSFGEWFQIAQDHVAEVNRQIGQIPDHAGLDLIDAQVGEAEGNYNRRAGKCRAIGEVSGWQSLMVGPNNLLHLQTLDIEARS